MDSASAGKGEPGTALKLWLEQFLQDLNYGLRALRRSPGFAALAVLTLALGIGANTAMFSVIDGVLLQTPPFRDPTKVTFVWQKQPNGNNNVFSTPDFLEWKRQSGPLAQMAALVSDSHALGTSDSVERITGWRASAEIFSVLGVSPVLGRPFLADDDRPGGGNVVVLSHELWASHFQSDPKILGTKVDLDGAPYTVIGVMPAGIQINSPNELFWMPLQLQTQDVAASSRTIHWLLALVRVSPETTIARSQAALDAIASRLHHDDPAGDAGFGVSLQSYQDVITSGIREPLLLLMGCVGFVLLIACSNVANLLLARGASRNLEISIRVAVGAQRSRVVRQLVTESIVLSVLGGALGLVLSSAGVKVLLALHPDSIPNVEKVTLNMTVLAFTLALCVLVGILFGIAPALVSSRVNLTNGLREAARGTSPGGRRQRAILVTGETALASILLIGAALSLKSLWKVANVNPGFKPEGLITFKIAAPAEARQQPAIFYQQVLDKVRALPGVESAVLARNVPMSGVDPSMPVAADGQPPQVTDGQIVTRLRVIGPDYFHSFQTTVLRGREFRGGDSQTSQPVVIISESLAQRYWPNQDPLGHSLKPNIADAAWYTVVGVVADVRHQGLDADIEPTAYYPFTQIPKSVMLLVVARYMTVIIRARGDMNGLMDSVRRAVASVNKTVPVDQVKTLGQMLLEASSLRRFDMWLLAAFAGLALALAAIGVYGLTAYSVSQRTREIGIRMALGARRMDVLGLIMKDGAKMAIAGVVIGVIGAIALTRLMASLLYQVSPTDVWSFALVSGIVLIFILLACYLPSLRATRVDPSEALRYE